MDSSASCRRPGHRPQALPPPRPRRRHRLPRPPGHPRTAAGYPSSPTRPCSRRSGVETPGQGRRRHSTARHRHPAAGEVVGMAIPGLTLIVVAATTANPRSSAILRRVRARARRRTRTRRHRPHRHEGAPPPTVEPSPASTSRLHHLPAPACHVLTETHRVHLTGASIIESLEAGRTHSSSTVPRHQHSPSATPACATSSPIKEPSHAPRRPRHLPHRGRDFPHRGRRRVPRRRRVS